MTPLTAIAGYHLLCDQFLPNFLRNAGTAKSVKSAELEYAGQVHHLQKDISQLLYDQF